MFVEWKTPTETYGEIMGYRLRYGPRGKPIDNKFETDYYKDFDNINVFTCYTFFSLIFL